MTGLTGKGRLSRTLLSGGIGLIAVVGFALAGVTTASAYPTPGAEFQLKCDPGKLDPNHDTCKVQWQSQYNNDKPGPGGETVSWSASDGGTFSPNPSTTDDHGKATSTFTANPSDPCGTQITLKGTESGGAISGTAETVVTTDKCKGSGGPGPGNGPPPNVHFDCNPNQLDSHHTSCVAKFQNDDHTAGNTVTFSVDPGYGSFNPPSAVTDNHGQAQSTFTPTAAACGAQVVLSATESGASPDDNVTAKTSVKIEPCNGTKSSAFLLLPPDNWAPLGGLLAVLALGAAVFFRVSARRRRSVSA